jgi:hypothetical protein
MRWEVQTLEGQGVRCLVEWGLRGAYLHLLVLFGSSSTDNETGGSSCRNSNLDRRAPENKQTDLGI